MARRKTQTTRRKYSIDVQIIAIAEELMLDPARQSARYGSVSGLIERLLRDEYRRLGIKTVDDARAFRLRTAGAPAPAPTLNQL